MLPLVLHSRAGDYWQVRARLLLLMLMLIPVCAQPWCGRRTPLQVPGARVRVCGPSSCFGGRFPPIGLPTQPLSASPLIPHPSPPPRQGESRQDASCTQLYDSTVKIIADIIAPPPPSPASPTAAGHLAAAVTAH